MKDAEEKTKKQFDNLRTQLQDYLMKFSEIWPRELTPEMVGIYTEALKKATPQDLAEACKRCLAECKFFPTPADIRERLAVTTSQDAEIEWDAVVRDIEAHGAQPIYTEIWKNGGPSGRFSPPKLVLTGAGNYALRQVGGRKAVANSDGGFRHKLHAEFVAAFERYEQSDALKALSAAEARNLLAKNAPKLLQ